MSETVAALVSGIAIGVAVGMYVGHYLTNLGIRHAREEDQRERARRTA